MWVISLMGWLRAAVCLLLMHNKEKEMRVLSEEELQVVTGGVDGRSSLTHEFSNNYGHGRADSWADQATDAPTVFVPEWRDPALSR